jgi:hypothetical protein
VEVSALSGPRDPSRSLESRTRGAPLNFVCCRFLRGRAVDDLQHGLLWCVQAQHRGEPRRTESVWDTNGTLNGLRLDFIGFFSLAVNRDRARAEVSHQRPADAGRREGDFAGIGFHKSEQL